MTADFLTLAPVVLAVFTVAATAQNVSGFGFGLVAIPLLAIVTTPQTAVVAASVLNLVLTGGTAFGDRRHIDWPTTAKLSAAAVLGMPAGLLILHTVSARALTALIAVVVTACAFVVWRGWRLKPTPPRIGAAGALSGLLLTATGTNGPPLVAATQALGLEPRAFRATLAAVFTGTGLLGVAGFCLAGQVDVRTAEICAVGLLGTVIGGWCGDRLFRAVDPQAFRRVVLGVLLVSAAAALVRAGAAF